MKNFTKYAIEIMETSDEIEKKAYSEEKPIKDLN
jgi:hypothetical protein